MQLRSEELYQAMQQELARCRQKDNSLKVQAECCFHTGEHYWRILREELAHYTFTSTAEEINFFKNIKPMFVAEMEYHRIIYDVLTFYPGKEHPEQVKKYREGQSKRLSKFIRQHKTFYDYYKAGRTDRDESYFLSKFFIPSSFEYIYYRLDERTSSNCDHLVACIIALERFQQWFITVKIPGGDQSETDRLL